MARAAHTGGSPTVDHRRSAGAGPFSHVLLITGSRTWTDEPAMREAFNGVWSGWGRDAVTRPVLLSGSNPRGADAMAERLWRSAGLEVVQFPADWGAHGKAAGFRRNQEMVDAAMVLRDHGAVVSCAAFLELCRAPACGQRDRQQLGPVRPGHFSHGTVHCRRSALAAGLPVVDVLSDDLAG